MNPARLAAKPFKLFSAQAAEHFQQFLQELYVALVHKRGARKARRFRPEGGLKINFGAGPAAKEGFLNVDFWRGADLRLDLRQPVPLPDGCASLVFTEHFLEHLKYPEETDPFLGNVRRILEPGGVVKISVPGTEWPLKEYASGGTEYLDLCEKHGWHPPGCETFMEHLNYHFRQRPPGRAESKFGCHRFAYDFATMKKLLERCGFTEVAEREFDSALDSEHRRIGSLFVQARKPAAPGAAPA